MKTKNGSFGCFFIMLIPVGLILLCIVINYFMDMYYQKKLDNDTVEVLKYIITKDLSSEEYKKLAMEQFEEREYTVNDQTVSVISNDEYVLLVKYDYIHDLRAFINIFKVKPLDNDGLVNEGEYNKASERYTGMISSKYIAKLNEYREPVIEKYKGDEDELFRKELEKQEQQQNTTQQATE